jgi:hypothetical protein
MNAAESSPACSEGGVEKASPAAITATAASSEEEGDVIVLASETPALPSYMMAPSNASIDAADGSPLLKLTIAATARPAAVVLIT